MFRIDSSRCNGCECCVQACPQGAISLIDGLAVIDQGLCIRCGSCVAVCPRNAISEVSPVTGTVRDRIPLYMEAGRGGGIMRGRGWFGMGYQRWGRGGGRGRGRGRYSHFYACRYAPWFLRRWWAVRPNMAPYTPVTRRPFV